jgi:hypothetical protein
VSQKGKKSEAFKETHLSWMLSHSGMHALNGNIDVAPHNDAEVLVPLDNAHLGAAAILFDLNLPPSSPVHPHGHTTPPLNHEMEKVDQGAIPAPAPERPPPRTIFSLQSSESVPNPITIVSFNIGGGLRLARKSRLGLEKGCYFKPGKGGLQDLQRLGTA